MRSSLEKHQDPGKARIMLRDERHPEKVIRNQVIGIGKSILQDALVIPQGQEQLRVVVLRTCIMFRLKSGAERLVLFY
jgi:hypothetical protein